MARMVIGVVLPWARWLGSVSVVLGSSEAIFPEEMGSVGFGIHCDCFIGFYLDGDIGLEKCASWHNWKRRYGDSFGCGGLGR